MVRAFELLAIAGIVSITGFHLLASLLDMPALWRLLVFVQGWPYFVVFGLASIPIKSLPLLVIMLRKLDQLIRQQAIVMLSGLLLGLSGWYLFLWAPTAVHPGSSKR
ncbi:MAG: hypothetical protein IBX64_11370 [Actinobacteria bacterium]|nr:hypothetical protein [Actinomycetota bacterium]